jgi:hypothetical protein
MPTPDILCLGHVYEELGFLEDDARAPDGLRELALSLREDPTDSIAVTIALLLREYCSIVKFPEPAASG